MLSSFREHNFVFVYIVPIDGLSWEEKGVFVGWILFRVFYIEILIVILHIVNFLDLYG